jgi:hypothetical protein
MSVALVQDAGAMTLRAWWSKHAPAVLRLGIGLMLVASAIWLSYQFWRLLWQPDRLGAIDLRYYHTWVHRWFTGESVHVGRNGAEYPPATFVLLWPLAGWLDFTAARWFMALTTVGALTLLTVLVVRESGAESSLERGFVALTVLSFYATGAAIGNGQLIVHLLPLLLASLLLVTRSERTWRRDALVAALFLFALAKPTISAPFFWLMLCIPARWSAAALVVAGYVGLSLFAAAYQSAGLAALLGDSLGYGSALAVGAGYANLHSWLSAVGLGAWILPASGAALAALGAWIYVHRSVDIWILLGVTAIVARLWTYHNWYDDLLILLPMVALFRLAKQRPFGDHSDVVAASLLAVAWVMTRAPGGLYLFPPPWDSVWVVGQITVWLALLVFLLDRARRWPLAVRTTPAPAG